MTKQEAFLLMGEIDERFVAAAEDVRPEKKKGGLPTRALASAAACLVLAGGILGAMGVHRAREEARIREEDACRTDGPASVLYADAQQWTPSMRAEEYFRNSGKSDGGEAMSSASLAMPPWALQVSLDERREAFEADGILPPMPEHAEQSFRAEYNGDGSLYKVSFWWMRRGEKGLDGYSDLVLTAAPEEIHEIDDVIAIPVDENGNEIPAGVTLTVRDGVLIATEGGEGRAKTLTWRTEAGWYRISGSWNDSFEDMASLLDWFWEHPLDLGAFAEPPAGTMLVSDRASYPEAFRGAVPDFAGLGYEAESERVNLAAGREGDFTPVWFEGVYTRGDTRIRWTVSTGADKDDFDACLGRPGEVTEERLAEAFGERDYVNIGFFGDRVFMATLCLEAGSAADAWEVVESMRD